MKKLVILLAIAAACSAETIQFVGLPANTAFGTYNGFGTATIDGVPGQLLVCDDYFHTTYFPSGDLQYVVSTLTGDHPLQYARFLDPGDPDGSIARYEQAALSVDGLLNTGPDSLLDLTAQYQYALWHLFSPAVVLPDATSATLLNDTRLAIETPSSQRVALYSRLRIYTPLNGYESNQEFLAFSNDPSWQHVDPPSPFPELAPPATVGDLSAPEPAAMILSGIGIALFLLGPLRRRFKHHTATSSKTRIMSR